MYGCGLFVSLSWFVGYKGVSASPGAMELVSRRIYCLPWLHHAWRPETTGHMRKIKMAQRNKSKKERNKTNQNQNQNTLHSKLSKWNQFVERRFLYFDICSNCK